MDNFTTCDDSFEETLGNIEKVLIIFQDTNLTWSNEKCEMMMKRGVVLGHIISSAGIEFDSTKIEVLSKNFVPNYSEKVRIILGDVGYYKKFIEYFKWIEAPLSSILKDDTDFSWENNCQPLVNMHLKLEKRNFQLNLFWGE